MDVARTTVQAIYASAREMCIRDRARMEQDSRLHGALEAGRGIRIFRQEPFEALLSFIISANNNIPRIQGIVERLCALCGRPLEAGGYAFPAPEDVCLLYTSRCV